MAAIADPHKTRRPASVIVGSNPPVWMDGMP